MNTEGHGQKNKHILFSGVAGIGKTRLLDHLINKAEDHSLRLGTIGFTLLKYLLTAKESYDAACTRLQITGTPSDTGFHNRSSKHSVTEATILTVM